MPVRHADAQWQGGLLDGNGTMRLGSGAYEGRYSFSSRFEEGAGSNPEELVAAAHAGCFSMALSKILGDAGYRPESIRTTAKVHLGKVGEGFGITAIELTTRGSVPGISEEVFREHAEMAKAGCPISRALAAVPSIRLDAALE
jgi:osmotically inducible protein OsmC